MPRYDVAGDFACVLTIHAFVEADTPAQAIELARTTLGQQAEEVEASLTSDASLSLGYPVWEPVTATDDVRYYVEPVAEPEDCGASDRAQAAL